MKSISFGQYYPSESVIHKTDPRAKVILAMLYIISSFVCKNILSFVLLIVSAIVIILLSRIPAKILLRSLKPLIVIIVFMSFLNLFMTKGGISLFSFWVFEITSNGIYSATSSVIRILTLILGTSIFLTYTTTPIALTDGIEQLLSPLKKVKVPVHEFAMMMTIALRFIPTLVEETDKIIAAQKARGADFTSGNLLKRAKALIPILVPLFISSFRRADELAIAMECRCYRGGEGRTRLHILKYSVKDILVIFISVLFLMIIILINFLGIDFGFVGNNWF